MGWEMELFTLLNAPSRSQAPDPAILATSRPFLKLEKRITNSVLIPDRVHILSCRRVSVPPSCDRGKQRPKSSALAAALRNTIA
jgi:hypothetical protein